MKTTLKLFTGILLITLYHSCNLKLWYDIEKIEWVFELQEDREVNVHDKYRITITHVTENDFNFVSEKSRKDTPDEFSKTRSHIGTYNPEERIFLFEMMGEKDYMKISDDYKTLSSVGSDSKYTRM